MRNFTLDGRLRSAAKFVRQGATFADIGTDHAYLPLFLLAEGKINTAVLADINEGPLDSARQNARDTGFFNRCRFFLTNGAKGLEGEGITDAAICGMGGELIVDIIDNAPIFRNTGVRLILQPMSHQADLRRYLAKEGFLILDEEYSYSAGKYYVTLCAEYTGDSYDMSEAEYEFGRCHTMSDENLGYLKVRLGILEKIKSGKAMGGEDTAYEDELICYLKTLLGDKT